MECLVLPAVSIFSRGCSCNRLGYQQLTEDDDELFVGSEDDPLIKVLVGKEKKLFLVDPLVLDEYPFRVLFDLVNNKKKQSSSRRRNSRMMVSSSSSGLQKRKVLYVDVDAILFEHMLWLMHNDSSSLFNLNLKEIIDFYAQDY